MSCIPYPTSNRRHFFGMSVVLALAANASCLAQDDIRIALQAEAGTSGFEPGVALEWRPDGLHDTIVRPEAFISEDGRPGAGGAVLYDLSTQFGVPARQAVAIGPRAVFHNSDDSGWEVDAMATWAYQLDGSDRGWRQSLGLIGALGVLHDRKHDENDVGATAGAFFSFRF